MTRLLPYSAPVVLPGHRTSPPEDPAAPYTPTVVSLIRPLESHRPPTHTELAIAAALLSTHGGTYAHPEGSNPTCHNLANVNVATATTPRILPLCFSDGLGINVDAGPNIERTTGLPSMLMLASSLDRELANAMGRVEGREGRNLMVTGLLGPQADTDVFVNWQRGHHTSGEDPFLNGVISAAQINGIQGRGLMSQVKHYAVYYLEPGQRKQVKILLDERSFQSWSEPRQQWVTNNGTRTIFVGEADALTSLPLTSSILIAELNR